MIVVAKQRGIGFRVFEEEMLDRYFGGIKVCTPEDVLKVIVPNDYLYWLLPTEDVKFEWWRDLLGLEFCLDDVEIINPLVGYRACHEKNIAFDIWKVAGVPCPAYCSFDSKSDLYERLNGWELPVLLRLNNRTNGDATYLVEDQAEAYLAFNRLEEDFQKFKDRGIETKKLCIQFIDTRIHGYYNSFRIIVAGNKIVTGYARLSNNWLAVTPQFELGMWDLFLLYQKLCENFCLLNEELIIKAAQCLGQDFVGVDVIVGVDGKPYFIETQYLFSVGGVNDKHHQPPYYNPTYPKLLVDLLKENESLLEKEYHLYWKWLHKDIVFDGAFRELKRCLDARSDS